MHLEHPTDIQRRAMPMVCRAERDVLINAPTGTGKTLVYLAPIINDLMVRRGEAMIVRGIARNWIADV